MSLKKSTMSAWIGGVLVKCELKRKKLDLCVYTADFIKCGRHVCFCFKFLLLLKGTFFYFPRMMIS